MENLRPSDFFSLHRYAHSSLWKEGEPVWSALHQLSDYLREWKNFKIEIEIPPGVHLQRPELISIGPGTIIEPGVFIQGPCIIGSQCIIRHGAYLRDSVICGDRCAIGHGTELKHSILLDFASATHFVYVGNSIIGSGVNLGAGVKCANLRLDRKEISVYLEGKKIKTGLKKMGAIIGDRSQVGCNAVLNPGTLVGKESVCFPLVSVGGYIPPRSQVKQTRACVIEPLEKNILEQIGQ